MNENPLLLQPKIVLGVAAHPDDLDFGAAGTMAKFIAGGARVYYLLVTDGGKGTEDRTITSADLVAQRQTEERNALKAIGGNPNDVAFLGYPDGTLEVTQAVKRDIVRHIRTIKPDVVVTLDPSIIYMAERGFINHPDHRAAGQATLDAVFPLARDHLSFPELLAEGFEPHKTPTVLLTAFGGPGNYLVDISTTIDQKIAALAAHPSQIPDIKSTAELLREFARKAAKGSGYEYAESFNRIDIR